MKAHRTPSLVNPRDPTHRAALAAGYSWRTLDWALATASEPFATRAHRTAHAELAAIRADRRTSPVDAWMRDAFICNLAKGRAEYMTDQQARLTAQTSSDDLLEWLNRTLVSLEGKPFRFTDKRPRSDQLRGFLARSRCPIWWRRQLRRAVVQLREDIGIKRGEICAATQQAYVTNDTLARHTARIKSNEALMEATVLENENGQCFTLAELIEKSPSAKPIRRGELMTRLRGCEELAESSGHRGVFLTLTAPSRFHSSPMAGGKNPAFDGSTPREAQDWLRNKWARARSRIQRTGLSMYGFRIAEPHHDGCPHWHMLLWVKPGDLWRIVLAIKRAWLKDGGDEPGARAHRCKAMLMHGGSATGYVAKYIAKNIDDACGVAVEGHLDSDPQGHNTSSKTGGTAARVAAWASAWGIRQFQAIGQPPVTVWRELRRIDAAHQQGCTEPMAQAFKAVNKREGANACWATYVRAQGGLMTGRHYRLRVASAQIEMDGRYERQERQFPLGVFDVAAPDVCHLSNRQEWRPKGSWDREPILLTAPIPPQFLIEKGRMVANPEHAKWVAAKPAEHSHAADPPWTCVNNCTELPGDI